MLNEGKVYLSILSTCQETWAAIKRRKFYMQRMKYKMIVIDVNNKI